MNTVKCPCGAELNGEGLLLTCPQCGAAVERPPVDGTAPEQFIGIGTDVLLHRVAQLERENSVLAEAVRDLIAYAADTDNVPAGINPGDHWESHWMDLVEVFRPRVNLAPDAPATN